MTKKIKKKSPPEVRVIVKASWVLEAAKRELEYQQMIGEIEGNTPADIRSFYNFLREQHINDWHVIDDMKGGEYNNDPNNL